MASQGIGLGSPVPQEYVPVHRKREQAMIDRVEQVAKFAELRTMFTAAGDVERLRQLSLDMQAERMSVVEVERAIRQLEAA